MLGHHLHMVDLSGLDSDQPPGSSKADRSHLSGDVEEEEIPGDLLTSVVEGGDVARSIADRAQAGAREPAPSRPPQQGHLQRGHPEVLLSKSNRGAGRIALDPHPMGGEAAAQGSGEEEGTEHGATVSCRRVRPGAGSFFLRERPHLSPSLQTGHRLSPTVHHLTSAERRLSPPCYGRLNSDLMSGIVTVTVAVAPQQLEDGKVGG